MKREHTTEKYYIDWLKSIGCVNYLPLLTNNTDLISGETATIRGNVGSYDQTKGLDFIGNGGLLLPNTLFSWMGYNQSFTALIDMCITTSSGYGKIFYWNFYGHQSNREKGLSHNYGYRQPYAHIDNGNWENSVYPGTVNYDQQYVKCGLVYYGDTHKFSVIMDGVIQNVWNTATGWNDADKYCYIGKGYSNDPFKGYLKNFMVFNRSLSQSEIDLI